MRLISPALHRAASVLGVALILAAIGLAPMPSLGTSSAQSSTCPPPPAGYSWEYLGTFVNPGTYGEMARFRGGLFFRGHSGGQWGLWVTDGTLWGTHLVWQAPPYKSIGPATAFRNKLFFRADNHTYGWQEEPWATDGTTEGTREWMDINPTGGSDPSGFTALGRQLFFSADDGTHGREPWVTGIRPESTRMLMDINPSGDADPKGFTALGGWVLFSADDGTHGRELWKSDGTEAGTVLVKDIDLGKNSSIPEYLTELSGTLFFTADDGTHGRELWKSDGTEAGTVLLKDINVGSDGSSPQYLTEVNGTLFFSADDGTHGEELWAMETSWWPEPYLVKDILPGEAGSRPRSFTAFDDRIFFWVEERLGQGYTALWATDGTQAGTCLISDKQAFPGYIVPPLGPPIKGALVVWTGISQSVNLLYALRPYDFPPMDTPTPVLPTPTDTPLPPTPTDTPLPPTPTDTPLPPTPTPLPPTNTPTPAV